MEEMYHKGSAAVKSIPGFGLETQKAARNSGLTSSPVFLLPHLDTLESKRFPRVFSEEDRHGSPERTFVLSIPS